MENREESKMESTVYEVGYLILSSIPEENLSTVVDSIRKVISKGGGTEIDSETPFKHPLAYSMSKTVGASRYVASDAYLGWIKFEVEPAKILAIKTGVEKIKEVLRFLLVKAKRETVFTFAKAKAAAEAAAKEAENKEELPDSVSDSEQVVK